MTSLKLIFNCCLIASAAGAEPSLPSAPPATVPVIPVAARPLPLTAVRLTDGPLKQAQDLDATYLLQLQPDRLLAYFRKRAGLAPKAEGYGGWDGDGKQLTGHILGHYLSAVSLMWVATGDARFKERADYIVKELKEVQNANGDGYLGALADGKERFAEVARGDIRSGGFDLNGLWSPWYVLHKDYAGLRDAYRFTGNPLALALEIKFAAWAEGILSKLDEAQTQRMLNTEFGGMNEVLADLYADTGDRRWLALSLRFEHHAILTPLKRHQDRLAGVHGNTQVPKLLGSLKRFTYTGDAGDGFAAGFFYDEVVAHHSFATGGHGRNEYFGKPDQLNELVDGRTAETCNVYNLLKMERILFGLRPDANYAEFQERALFNHILASIDPEDGRTCYMVPVGRGVQHEYQDMFQSFTCCVGSGMESHALHGDGIYYESPGRLWINLYVPSTAQWRTEGVHLTLSTHFPEGDSASLKLALVEPRSFTLALRRPAWAREGFAVKVNGESITNLPQPSAYVEISRTWKNDDTVAITLPKTLRLEPLADNPRRAAILWGPLVLAGDLGPEQPEDGDNANRAGAGKLTSVFLAAGQPVAQWVKPVAGKPGCFRTAGVGRERDVDLVPFYRLHRRHYAVYWDLYTPEEWRQQSEILAAAEGKARRLAAATIGFAQPGEMQPERDFNFQGEDSAPIRLMDRPGRRGAKWFSFDLPVDPTHPAILIVTYNTDERNNCAFEIQVNGQMLREQTIERRTPERDARFFDAEYPLPFEALRNKAKVTVRFQAATGGEIAAIYGLRTVRADAER
jgi:uncharacterized protein